MTRPIHHLDKTETVAHAVNVLPNPCRTGSRAVTVRRMAFNPVTFTSETVLQHPERRARYAVRLRWAVIAGRMEPVEIQVGTVRPAKAETSVGEKAFRRLPIAAEATAPLLVTDYRKLGLQRLIDTEREAAAIEYRAYVREHGQPGPDTRDGIEGWTPAALRAHYMAPFAAPPRKGTDVPPDEYEEVAEIYRAAYADGHNPRQAVAEHFGISPDAAAKRVQRARERGLLPKTQPGRPAAVVASRPAKRRG
jgi:hypothetical protein